MNDQERFFAKVDKTESCWNWTSTKHERGYGRFYLGGLTVRAHRLAYEWFVGPIPDGLQIDHLCRNTSCVNPDHLEAVTNQENSLRGVGPTSVNAKKTHCIRGHELDGVNLMIRDGRRICRTCQNLTAQLRRDARRKPPRTHCGRGHEFDSENTYVLPNGYRRCRACERFRSNRRKGGYARGPIGRRKSRAA